MFKYFIFNEILRRRSPAYRIAGTTGSYAAAIGKGIVAGFIGTAVMTLAQAIEMKITKRKGSEAPAEGAKKVLDVKATTKEKNDKVNNLVHWTYGSYWGIARGILAESGMKGWGGNAVHFAAVWGTALWMLPTLKLAPPPQKWGGTQLAKDALFHAIYSTATGYAYDFIDHPMIKIYDSKV
jgi:hypothetical protein